MSVDAGAFQTKIIYQLRQTTKCSKKLQNVVKDNQESPLHLNPEKSETTSSLQVLRHISRWKNPPYQKLLSTWALKNRASLVPALRAGTTSTTDFGRKLVNKGWLGFFPPAYLGFMNSFMGTHRTYT